MANKLADKHSVLPGVTFTSAHIRPKARGIFHAGVFFKTGDDCYLINGRQLVHFFTD
jgi:hypothetical protein